MTDDLAREIKNEFQVFQHSTDITIFRLTFDEHYNDQFSKYGVYDTSADLEERDCSCIYLAYILLIIKGCSMVQQTIWPRNHTSHTKVYFNEFVANVFCDDTGIVIFDLRGHGGF